MYMMNFAVFEVFESRYGTVLKGNPRLSVDTINSDGIYYITRKITLS